MRIKVREKEREKKMMTSDQLDSWLPLVRTWSENNFHNVSAKVKVNNRKTSVKVTSSR